MTSGKTPNDKRGHHVRGLVQKFKKEGHMSEKDIAGKCRMK